jgi:aminomethyltransferase
MQQTALYPEHQQQQAKLVDFHGWEMPLHYGSQLEEHHAVRSAVGVFDVSHMTVVDCRGPQAMGYLRRLLANDVAKLVDGQAMYSCMLNEAGGVVDDLITYRRNEHDFRLVVNSSTREKDLAWLQQLAQGFDVVVTELEEKIILAIQGPKALEWAPSLKPFRFIELDNIFFARTGYTGEQGVEIILPVSEGKALWKKLMDAGVQACGLGARDTLRLEAGLNLYGNDMDESTSPLVSNLAWTISFDDPARDFMGRAALKQAMTRGAHEALVGVKLLEKGVLRDGQKIVFRDGREGVITSGGFSPTLNVGIGFARVPLPLSDAQVDIRGKLKEVALVKLPFVTKATKKTGE